MRLHYVIYMLAVLICGVYVLIPVSLDVADRNSISSEERFAPITGKKKGEIAEKYKLRNKEYLTRQLESYRGVVLLMGLLLIVVYSLVEIWQRFGRPYHLLAESVPFLIAYLFSSEFLLLIEVLMLNGVAFYIRKKYKVG